MKIFTRRFTTNFGVDYLISNFGDEAPSKAILCRFYEYGEFNCGPDALTLLEGRHVTYCDSDAPVLSLHNFDCSLILTLKQKSF